VRSLGQGFQGFTDQLLYRVIGLDITFDRKPTMTGYGQKPGMFAGTIVVKGRWFVSGSAQRGRRRAMGWPLRAAFQRAFVKPGGIQHGGGKGDVTGFAAMGCLRQGQFTLAIAEPVGRAAFDQRQRLDRLDGGTRKNRLLDIAECEEGPAVGAKNGNRAAMAAFHAVATHYFDEDGIGHGFLNLQ